MLHDSNPKEVTAKILLVEDSASDAYLVGLAVETIPQPCKLIHCIDPDDALRLLKSCDRSDAPQLIILDLNTPGKSGFDLLIEVHKLPALAGTPVLVLTSSISPDDRARAMRLGVNAYVSKPLDLDRFLSDVSSAIEETLSSYHFHAVT